NLEKVKVIWLGQDVYPSKEKATGRAFEVGDLQDWTDSFRQTSLKNIIRLINKNYYGVENYKEIKKFSQIKEEIKSNKFDLKPQHNWFESLEEQGVLFLNTSFTYEIGVPNSHRGLWSKFSQQVLEFISVNRPDIVWFLEAISNKKYINNGVFYESRHPSRVSESYKDDFLKFEEFKETMEIIDWIVIVSTYYYYPFKMDSFI
ncbi:uracil-DNA glycosylase, partial [Bacillus subtilis]